MNINSNKIYFFYFRSKVVENNCYSIVYIYYTYNIYILFKFKIRYFIIYFYLLFLEILIIFLYFIILFFYLFYFIIFKLIFF